MSINLYCPQCGDSLGNERENPKKAMCGRCGKRDIENSYGFDPVDKKKKKKIAEVVTMMVGEIMNEEKE